MSVVPGGVDTDQQPPMTVPLRHFLVALGFLLLGVGLGAADAAGVSVGRSDLAHLHLLLVGWICVTILGAMTQFVPVWSGVALHSRRLAVWQLWLLAGGLVGFVTALVAGRFDLLPLAGLAMLAGFCTFAYNVGRTLLAAGESARTADVAGSNRADSNTSESNTSDSNTSESNDPESNQLLSRLRALDRTERHFAFALACFVLLATLGVLLALDFTRPVFHPLGLARSNVVGAHATLAVFGAILTTVLGALYQLGTMFTQTELHGVEHWLARFEGVAYPTGVVALALGRLLGAEPLAAGGGLLVAAGVAVVAAILARKLVEMRGPWTPMHRRYAVAALAMGLWSVLAARAWLSEPLAHANAFGAPGSVHLLTLGAIAFVVFGTLYHVVPFVVWVHRYADLLGYEPVPTIDDLYDDRLARVDFALLLAGSVTIVARDALDAGLVGGIGAGLAGRNGGGLVSGLGAGFDGGIGAGFDVGPEYALGAAGGVLVGAGCVVFVANLLLVLRRHSPHALSEILLGSSVRRDATEPATGSVDDE